MIGKRVQFDDETWQALDMLARDRMMNFQELADEAFADLLRKHDRPTDLKDALKRSVKERSNSREDKPARRAPRGRHD
jgi:non-homologous end joining protein Ku